jgi:transposase
VLPKVFSHTALAAMIQQLSGPVKVGFEATGAHEWVIWTELINAGSIAVQLSPAQIKAFALSRIDAELIARFMVSRPEAGRELPLPENIRILRTLTTLRGQFVDMRKRLKAGHNRKRDHQNPQTLEASPRRINTVSIRSKR